MQSFWYLILYKWWRLSPKAHYELLFDAQKNPTGRAWAGFLAISVGLWLGYCLILKPFITAVMLPFLEPRNFIVVGLIYIFFIEIVFHLWGLCLCGIALGHIQKSENLIQKPYWQDISKYNLLLSIFVLSINTNAFILPIFWLLLQGVCFILCKIIEPILYRKMLLFKSETLLFDANQLDVLDEHFVKKDEK
jgi:hypothetical protein